MSCPIFLHRLGTFYVMRILIDTRKDWIGAEGVDKIIEQ